MIKNLIFKNYSAKVATSSNKVDDSYIRQFPIFSQAVWMSVQKANYDEQYALMRQCPDAYGIIKTKVSYLFADGYEITTIDGKISPQEQKIIDELTAIFARTNNQKKIFDEALRNTCVRVFASGLGFIERAKDNTFYDSIITSNIVLNFDKNGMFQEPPFFYDDQFNSKQPLYNGSIVMLKLSETQGGYYQDYRRLMPISPLSVVLPLVTGSVLTTYYQQAFFKNGVMPSSVITLKDGRTMEDATELFQALIKKYGLNEGQNSAFSQELKDTRTGELSTVKVPWGAPLILPEYAEFKEGLPLKDMQFKEFLEYVKQQVAAVYQLPMTLLPGSSRTSTLGSGKEVEEDEKRYINNVCNDEKGMFEKQLTSQLFTDNEKILKETGYGFKVANTTDLSRICFKFKRRHYIDPAMLISGSKEMLVARDRGYISTEEYREYIKPLLPVFEKENIPLEVLKSMQPFVQQSAFSSAPIKEPIEKEETEKEESKEMQKEKEGLQKEMQKEEIEITLDALKELVASNKACKEKDCACHTLSAKASARFPVFGSKARDYNKIKNEISKIENESAKGIEDIIYRMVEKWFKELSEAFPGGEITSGNIVSKLKLKDKNILRAFIQEMLRKSWQSGSTSQTQDPNVKKVMKMRGKAIDDAAGLWDYSIIDEMIDLISESQTDKITVDIITKLRQSVKDAIKKNRSVDELANEILASGTDGMLKKTYDNAKTEARTALAEARQQARFKTATERLGAEYVQFDAIIDDATTEVCTAANGLIFKADDPNILLPPLHYNCRSEINAIYTEQLDEAVSELPKDSRDDLFENPAYVEEVSQMIPEGF